MPKKNQGKTVTVEQTGSPIRRPAEQRATLIGLGLNRIRRRKTLHCSSPGWTASPPTAPTRSR